MKIVDLAVQPESVREWAAVLLVDGFQEPKGWPNVAAAREEVARVLHEGFGFAMVEDAIDRVRTADATTGETGVTLLGWVGGLPQYQGRVWELHPIVVRRELRRRGIGRALVAAFESEARERGALTVWLGTDDDSGMTSLSDVDLYGNLPRHIAEVRDLGRGHPFLFYRKLGFVVTGVMPDANGPGRPDIYMAKPIRR